MSSATHTLAPARCPNCAQDLDPHDRFCRHCGQDTANHPPTLWEFIHEFITHYVAAEGTLWKSIAGLMFHPGFLTREYLAGRKQRYVLPLRLLLTLGLLFFVALKLTPNSMSFNHKGTAEGLSAAQRVAQPASAASSTHIQAGPALDVSVSPDATSQLPEFLRLRMARAAERWRQDEAGALRYMSATVIAWAPYAVLCSLPFFAGLLKLFYPGSAYGRHFVFALHLHAAWYAMLFLYVLMPSSWMPERVVSLWACIYALMALRKVYAKPWLGTWLRAIPLALLHVMMLIVGYGVLAIVGVLSVA